MPNRSLRLCRLYSLSLARFIIAFTCTLSASQLVAQANHTPLPLNDAIAAALAHYPTAAVRLAQIRLGEARVEEAQHAWLPTALATDQISFGTDNALSGSYFPLGIPSTTGGTRAKEKLGVSGGNIAAVTASWEVYNFGAYGALTNEARAGLNVDKANLEQERYQLTNAVARDYFDLAKFASLMRIQEQNIHRGASIKLAVKALADNGLRPGVDTSIAEAELSKARLVFLELENAYAITKTRLATFTGLDTSIIIPDTNIASKLAPLAAQLAPESDTAKIVQHPFVQYYNAILDDNLAQETLIKKSYLPKILLMGSGWLRGSSISPTDVFDADPLTGLLYSRANYLFGAAITYDLFSDRKMKYRLDVQRARSEVAHQNVELEKTNVTALMSEANVNLRFAANRLREIPIQTKAANDAYLQKMALYNAGLTTIVEVTNALYVLNRAETDTVLGEDAMWKAIFQKAYADNQMSLFLSILK